MAKKKKSKPPVKVVKDKVRIPGKNNGYVQDPRYGLGMTARWSSVPKDPEFYDTENEIPPEPESPDLSKNGPDRWIVTEAKERDELRKRRPLHEELELIELRLRPDQKRELRRRIEGLKRSIHKKAA